MNLRWPVYLVRATLLALFLLESQPLFLSGANPYRFSLAECRIVFLRELGIRVLLNKMPIFVQNRVSSLDF